MTSSTEPALNEGITLAVLRSSGNTPLLKDKLIIRQSGTAIKSATIFIHFRGILACPVALMGSEVMRSIISSSDTCAIMNSYWTLFLMNCSGDLLGTLGTLFSVFGPTFTKKSLKPFAIPIESSTAFPLIFRCETLNLVAFLTLTIFLIPSQAFFILLLCSSKYELLCSLYDLSISLLTLFLAWL